VKSFWIDPSPLDTARLRATLHADPRAGAVAEFNGLVRQHNDGRPVRGLRYEAYVELAEREGDTIMREALARVREQAPELEVDGEMHGDCALDETLRENVLPTTTLKGAANLLICPNVDSGNIAYNLLKTAAGGNMAIGPFLLGVNAPVHILTSSSTVRRIVNMTAIVVVDANAAGAAA